MSPADARMVQLAAELRADWTAVEANLARAGSVEPAAGQPEAALVALALDHAYQAFETLLLRLERGLALARRGGDRWHAELLEAAALDLPGLRPPVIPATAARAWRDLLRFRHFLRHAYAVELEARRLVDTRDAATVAIERTRSHIDALIGALVA